MSSRRVSSCAASAPLGMLRSRTLSASRRRCRLTMTSLEAQLLSRDKGNPQPHPIQLSSTMRPCCRLRTKSSRVRVPFLQSAFVPAFATLTLHQPRLSLDPVADVSQWSMRVLVQPNQDRVIRPRQGRSDFASQL